MNPNQSAQRVGGAGHPGAGQDSEPPETSVGQGGEAALSDLLKDRWVGKLSPQVKLEIAQMIFESRMRKYSDPERLKQLEEEQISVKALGEEYLRWRNRERLAAGP